MEARIPMKFKFDSDIGNISYVCNDPHVSLPVSLDGI